MTKYSPVKNQANPLSSSWEKCITEEHTEECMEKWHWFYRNPFGRDGGPIKY